ncbi:MAG: hypothetical protein KY432_00580 [Acidobacteria bacterium]|nr:hypothetical protein [Acidobacteriota bacterium]
MTRLIKPVFLTILLALTVPVWAAGDSLVSRAFELEHKDPQRVIDTVQGLLSRDGSYSIQPAKQTIVITDTPATLERVAEVLGQLDVPPRNYTLNLTLVSASRSANPPKVAQDLIEISRKMSGVLRFNTFEKLGSATTRGNEGTDLVFEIDGYQARFGFGQYDPLSQSLRIDDFRLDRTKDSTGSPLIRTSLNLRVGQTVVLGASRQPESGKALMIVLLAEENR